MVKAGARRKSRSTSASRSAPRAKFGCVGIHGNTIIISKKGGIGLSNSNKQAASLVKDLLSALESFEQDTSTNPELRQVLRTQKKYVQSELSKLANCRHKNDRTIWLILQRISNSTIDLLQQITRNTRIYKLCLQGRLIIMSLGRNIKLIRTARGIGLSDLAMQAGISISYLSLVESERRTPSIKVAESIAKHLRVPMSVLFWQPNGSQSTGITSLPESSQGMVSALYSILNELSETATVD